MKRNFSGMLKRNFPRHPICQWVKGRTNSETVLPSHWASCGLCWGPTSLHDYMYETWMWSGKINVKFFKAAPDDGEWKSTYGTACQAESNMSKHVRHSFETYQKTRMRVFFIWCGINHLDKQLSNGSEILLIDIGHSISEMTRVPKHRVKGKSEPTLNIVISHTGRLKIWIMPDHGGRRKFFK